MATITPATNGTSNGTAPAVPAQSFGKNVVGHIEGDTLYLAIDLTADFGSSKSGNSTIIATTSGNVTIPGTSIKLGLNAYK